MNFTKFHLHERLNRALESAGYLTPTPIQSAAMPVALEGNDLVGTAQTGTGKTAAFVLPILQRLLTNPPRERKMRALILTPTRELAEQIHTAIQLLGAHTNLRSATIYGGVGMMPQERSLRQGIEIIVACPGRLIDHIQRGNVNFSQIEFLVLDEADRMLDMGFLPPITRIIGLLPKDRQTMLFSATFAKELNNFVDDNLRSPKRIDIGLSAPAETVSHLLYPVAQHQKTALLTKILRRMDTESVLIFTRTKHRANRVAEQLANAGYNSGVLHSNKSQAQRQHTLDQFRNGKVQMLVATDIAARGIDVSTISHVINYDIPDCADSYIHRIGRTGRMERTGEALTFVTPADNSSIRDIERALGKRIETCLIEGFDYMTPAPKKDIEFQRIPQPPRQHKAPTAARKSNPSHRIPVASIPAGKAPAAHRAPSAPAQKLHTANRASAPRPPAPSAAKQGYPSSPFARPSRPRYAGTRDNDAANVKPGVPSAPGKSKSAIPTQKQHNRRPKPRPSSPSRGSWKR